MSRLWDLQAVYLAEVFTLYRSRRPSSRFSQRFEDLLSGVSETRTELSPNLTLTTPLASGRFRQLVLDETSRGHLRIER